ncbi:hypothetical protein [uncultured Clostridium sp.]|jgi:flagellar hook-length control protein FliK|uniref:flagellar hook-length control protein FliK n=1 Tax=uncultured Clostridium sp. TaxID=59620 RepID=UPI00261AD853|nr:hypothetical protein [uncultured Clostridium sp.]
MRLNTVNVIKVDFSKNNKASDKKYDGAVDETSFEDMLAKRNASKNDREIKDSKGSKDNFDKKVSSKNLKKENNIESEEIIQETDELTVDSIMDILGIDNVIGIPEYETIENANNQLEDVDMVSLLSMLFLVSNNESIAVPDLQNNKEIIDSVKETMNQFFLGNKLPNNSLEGIDLNLDELNDVKGFLENILGKMNLTNIKESFKNEISKNSEFKEEIIKVLNTMNLSSQDIKESLENINPKNPEFKEEIIEVLNKMDLSSKDIKESLKSINPKDNEFKEMIIKALNEKGLSNEDIKEFNISLKGLEVSKATKKPEVLAKVISNEEGNTVLDIKTKVDSSKQSNGNLQDSNTKESQLGKQESSKEDDFLSKLLAGDKSNFDMNLQRVKDLSSVQKTDSKLTINKESINADIKNTMVHMTKVNMKELIVKVNPGNLGEISIKLIAEADSMKAVIKVSSRETYALISGQDIKQYLGNESIKISNVEIELYKDDTTFFNESNEFMGRDESKRNYNGSSKNEFMEFEDEVEEEISLSSLDIII